MPEVITRLILLSEELANKFKNISNLIKQNIGTKKNR